VSRWCRINTAMTDSQHAGTEGFPTSPGELPVYRDGVVVIGHDPCLDHVQGGSLCPHAITTPKARYTIQDSRIPQPSLQGSPPPELITGSRGREVAARRASCRDRSGQSPTSYPTRPQSTSAATMARSTSRWPTWLTSGRRLSTPSRRAFLCALPAALEQMHVHARRC